MKPKSFAGMDCSVAQCLEVVGERWTLLILRDAFLGVRRFDDFQRRLGIARNVLHQRLGHLVEAGVLDRVPYSTHPPRCEYRLTQKGRDLWPVLVAMRQWGDRHAAPKGAPVQLVHTSCGATMDVDYVCGACRQPITVRDVTAIPGAGREELLARATGPAQ